MAQPDDFDALLREIEAATGPGSGSTTSRNSNPASGAVSPASGTAAPQGTRAGSDSQRKPRGGSALRRSAISGAIAAAATGTVMLPLTMLPGISPFSGAIGAFVGAAGAVLVTGRK